MITVDNRAMSEAKRHGGEAIHRDWPLWQQRQHASAVGDMATPFTTRSTHATETGIQLIRTSARVRVKERKRRQCSKQSVIQLA